MLLSGIFGEIAGDFLLENKYKFHIIFITILIMKKLLTSLVLGSFLLAFSFFGLASFTANAATNTVTYTGTAEAQNTGACKTSLYEYKVGAFTLCSTYGDLHGKTGTVITDGPGYGVKVIGGTIFLANSGTPSNTDKSVVYEGTVVAKNTGYCGKTFPNQYKIGAFNLCSKYNDLDGRKGTVIADGPGYKVDVTGGSIYN